MIEVHNTQQYGSDFVMHQMDPRNVVTKQQ